MRESNKAVYAAILGNVGVAAAKFAAALMFGGSAMLAEAFHSVVDTANDSLLLFGRYRSHKPPDPEHPMGHGQELYFWSFVVAMLVFAVGSGFSIYEGVMSILHPQSVRNALLSYIVLGAAACFEGSSLWVGYHEFRKEARGRSLWRTLRESKDPPTFSVVLEDFAAVIGLALAFLGIWLSEQLNQPVWDGAASIAIGVLLSIVALIMARESKGLLLGEAMNAASREDLRRIVRESAGVRAANQPLTLYFGPNNILMAIEVSFTPGLAGDELTSAVDEIERRVREKYPDIQRIFIEAEAIRSSKNQVRSNSRVSPV